MATTKTKGNLDGEITAMPVALSIPLTSKFQLYPSAFVWFAGYSATPPLIGPLGPGGAVREQGCWPHRFPVKHVPLTPLDPYDENKGYGFEDPSVEIPVTQEDIDTYGSLVVMGASWKTFTYFAGFTGQKKTFTVKNSETGEVIYTYQADVPRYIRVKDIYTGQKGQDGEWIRRFWMGVGKMAWTDDYGVTWDESELEHHGIPSGTFGWSHKDMFTPSWEHGFSAGKGRVVIPNVYSKQYPLNDANWKGTKLIAGVAPEENNYIYQNEPWQGPLGRGDRASAQCYIGNDEVLYYDVIHIQGRSLGGTSGFPQLQPTGQIPLITVNRPPAPYQPQDIATPGNSYNPIVGEGWAWTGPTPIMGYSGALLYKDANTYLLNNLPFGNHKCITGYGKDFVWKVYSPELGEIIYDVHPYMLCQGICYWFEQYASMLSQDALRSNMLSSIQGACSQYCANGGISYLNAGTPPEGLVGYTGHSDGADYWGPGYSCDVTVVVKGRISGNKIVPVEAYPQGYQWSGDLGGWHWTLIQGHSHHNIGWLGYYISKDEHNTGRRGKMIHPKFALSNSVIIGQCWDCYGYGIDMVDPTRPAGYDNGEVSIMDNGKMIFLYGWPLAPVYPPLHCTDSAYETWPENQQARAGAFYPRMPPDQTAHTETVSEVGAAQYFEKQKTRWHRYLCLSTDGGRTWGPYLPDPTKIGEIKGPDYDWGGYPWVQSERGEDAVQPPYDPVRTYHLTELPKTIIIAEGVGACVIGGKLWKIDANGFSEIPLVDDALVENPVTHQLEPAEVTSVLCNIARGQFLFTCSAGNILSYNNCAKMKLVEIEGGGSPIFFKTHYGQASSMYENDLEYPYDAKTPDLPLAIESTTLPDPIYQHPYDEPIRITGGVPPYTLVKSEGELPTGLTLDTVSYRIKGTPTNTDGSWFQIKVTDSSTPIRNRIPVYQDYTLIPNDPYKEEVTLSEVGTGTSVPIGRAGVGLYFVKKLAVAGGKPPYTLTWVDYPDGLTLDPKTYEIFGYATTVGEYFPKITVVDSHVPVNTVTFYGTLSVTTDLFQLDPW